MYRLRVRGRLRGDGDGPYERGDASGTRTSTRRVLREGVGLRAGRRCARRRSALANVAHLRAVPGALPDAGAERQQAAPHAVAERRRRRVGVRLRAGGRTDAQQQVP